jgi:hypothetical protein
MACYKIEKNGIARYKNFDNLPDAQTYADSLGTGFVVSLENEQNFPPFIRTLGDDIRFCNDLYNNFVQQNRDNNITFEESQELIGSLSSLKQLVDAGAVGDIIIYLQSLITPIARVYTTERRDLDVLKIQSYMDSL